MDEGGYPRQAKRLCSNPGQRVKPRKSSREQAFTRFDRKDWKLRGWPCEPSRVETQAALCLLLLMLWVPLAKAQELPVQLATKVTASHTSTVRPERTRI